VLGDHREAAAVRAQPGVLVGGQPDRRPAGDQSALAAEPRDLGAGVERGQALVEAAAAGLAFRDLLERAF
jgi:hypothetical protein